MSPEQIRVGVTYMNRGAGKTKRTVLGIGAEYRPEEYHEKMSPGSADEPGVLYSQNGKERKVFLSMFAAWCGKPCDGEHGAISDGHFKR